MQQAFPIYKLMILEMLNKVDFPLTNSQITEFLVKYNYASYFEVQETFSDLAQTKLILEEQLHHCTRYRITEEGLQTLTHYRYLVPDSFLRNIQTYLKENKIVLRNRVSVIAGYMPVSTGGYIVQCRILEGGKSIFDLSLPAVTTELAEKMCFNFEKKQAQLYAHIFSELTNEPKDSFQEP